MQKKYPHSFQFGRCPPSWISDEGDFNHPARSADRYCTSLSNSSTIAQCVAELMMMQCNFSSRFSGGRGEGRFVPILSVEWTELHEIWDGIWELP